MFPIPAYSAYAYQLPQGHGPLVAYPQQYAYQPEQQQPQVADATLDFQQTLNDPTRWVVKQGVPIFKCHERIDPATGKLIKVDVPKLYRIAQNMQQMERGGVPVRLTVGHTEPDKPEMQQPPVGGYYRFPRVQAFGPKQEPAIVVDEWLDPQYTSYRKNYPYRSSEYYDDTESITGVALLAKDPFLDLGVVAYQATGRLPTCYDRNLGLLAGTSAAFAPVRYANPATGRVPVMYRLTLGELPMFPGPIPTSPYPNAFFPQPPVPTMPPAPGYAPAPPTPYGQPTWTAPPANYGAPLAPPPVPYAAPVPGYAPAPPVGYAAPPTPYLSSVMGDWDRGYSRPSMQRQHSDQWNYGRGGYAPRTAYAPEGPGGPPMGGGGPPGGGGGGGGPLEALYQTLVQAVQIMQEMMEGASQAPQGAMPGGPPPGGGGGPPVPNARYGRGMQGPPPRGFPGGGGGRGMRPYNNPNEPLRTISGQPVGYQLALDRLNYQNQQANRAIQVLMYERDQSDTQECVAEIRRLASMGYPVGDEEIIELKKTPRQARPQYLDRIAAKYQRVPTDQPPPLLGDPTPGYQEDLSGRPLSEEEMAGALKMIEGTDDPQAFNKAVNYIRQNRGGTRYGQNRIAGFGPPQPPVNPLLNGTWGPGQPAQDPNQQYFAPSPNGNGRY